MGSESRMKATSRRAFSTGIALLPALRFTAAFSQSRVTPEEARAIAKEAYIYGYPLADNYRVEHAYFVDPKNPEFKAPWNHIKNIPRGCCHTNLIPAARCLEGPLTSGRSGGSPRPERFVS